MHPVVECVEITKRFGTIVANDSLSIRLEPGRLHALLGENGAGKSTLMKVISGYYKPDTGLLKVDGQEVRPRSPMDALRLGIYFIPQSYALIPRFSIYENLWLAPSLRKNLFLDKRQVERTLSYGGSATLPKEDLSTPVENLSMAVQQHVELSKAMSQDVKLLLMDEPTSLLMPHEVDSLFEVLRKKVDGGLSVLMSTHKIDDISGRADEVHFIGKGRIVGHLESSERAELLLRVAGSYFSEPGPSPSPSAQGDLVTVRDLSVRDELRRSLDAVSFTVRRGEIVGVAGAAGNGQDVLGDAMSGLVVPRKGSISIDGTEMVGRSRRDFIDLVGYVPENVSRGLNQEFTIAENLALDNYGTFFSHGYKVRDIRSDSAVDGIISDFKIMPPRKDMQVKFLSGGNAQKVVVARELSRRPRLLIAHSLTKGLDFGTAHLVYQKVKALAEGGSGVLLISGDLDELVEMCSRVLVLENGTIISELQADISVETVSKAIMS